MMRHSAPETGFVLIEVLIGAVLLATIVISTFTAFDASNRFTSNEQDRAQANAIAQQDQDRLRGMQVSQLDSLNQSRTITLNGTTFTVTSTGQFRSDTSGTSSCGAQSSADYIKTTSTVTWPAMGKTPPVVAESIITPPAGGVLIVQVINSTGAGVASMNVSGSGTAGSFSDTTGADGCAIFGGLNGGDYNVTVSQTGYVDKDGNATPPTGQQAVTVIPGSTATKTFYFDQAGTLNVTFQTHAYGNTSSWQAVNGDALVMFNTNMTYPGFRYFPNSSGTPGTPVAQLTASSLFPFTSTYTVYAGSCAANSPATVTSGGTANPSVTIPPGGTASTLLNLPALNVTVYQSNGTTALSGAKVTILDTGCTPNVRRTYTTNASGQIANPALPWGTYTVCEETTFYGGVLRHVSAPSAVTNSNLNGTTVKLVATSVAASGACP